MNRLDELKKQKESLEQQKIDLQKEKEFSDEINNLNEDINSIQKSLKPTIIDLLIGKSSKDKIKQLWDKLAGVKK